MYSTGDLIGLQENFVRKGLCLFHAYTLDWFQLTYRGTGLTSQGDK